MKIDRKWRRTVKPWMKSYIRYAMLDRGERLSLAWKCHFSLVVTVRPRDGCPVGTHISPTIYIRQCDYLTSITYENRINWSKNYDRDRWQLNFLKTLKQVTPKSTFLNHTTLFKQRDQASPRNERAWFTDRFRRWRSLAGKATFDKVDSMRTWTCRSPTIVGDFSRSKVQSSHKWFGIH